MNKKTPELPVIVHLSNFVDLPAGRLKLLPVPLFFNLLSLAPSFEV